MIRSKLFVVRRKHLLFFHTNVCLLPHVASCGHRRCVRVHSSFAGTCAGLQRIRDAFVQTVAIKEKVLGYLVLFGNPYFMLGHTFQFDPQVKGDVSRLARLSMWRVRKHSCCLGGPAGLRQLPDSANMWMSRAPHRSISLCRFSVLRTSHGCTLYGNPHRKIRPAAPAGLNTALLPSLTKTRSLTAVAE